MLKNGNFLSTSCIIRKPKTLRTEFKTICYLFTSILMHIETLSFIILGKIGMKNQACIKELRAAAACATRASKSTAQDKEAVTVFIGDAFAAISQNVEAVCQVKSNYGLCPKQFVEEGLKKALGGTHNWKKSIWVGLH